MEEKKQTHSETITVALCGCNLEYPRVNGRSSGQNHKLKLASEVLQSEMKSKNGSNEIALEKKAQIIIIGLFSGKECRSPHPKMTGLNHSCIKTQPKELLTRLLFLFHLPHPRCHLTLSSTSLNKEYYKTLLIYKVDGFLKSLVPKIVILLIKIN